LCRSDHAFVLLMELKIMQVVSRSFKAIVLQDMKDFLQKDFENYARKTLMVRARVVFIYFHQTCS
jgi:hypothetical protein